MVQNEGRVIRPPVEQITSGRVFQPTNMFIGKKILKAIILMIVIWGGIYLLFLGLADPIVSEILLAMSQPLELLLLVGWELVNFIYMIAVVIVLVVGSIYATIYVKLIEYSVLGWKGESMPEIYTKRGILTITKRHVPFRTVTNVQTRRGIFDRIFGIGTVLIETAGGTTGPPVTGLVPLLIQKLGMSNKSEERIEGIRFHEELRDYILREIRQLGEIPAVQEKEEHMRRKKQIFTRRTLEAFKEVRDALVESRESGV